MEKDLKKGTRKWLALMIILGIGLMLVSCKVHEPLEGLCYTDKRGTYLCEETERTLEIERELEEEVEKQLMDPPIDDLFEHCKGLQETDAWHWCINIHRIA